MADVRQCDNCTILRPANTGQWITIHEGPVLISGVDVSNLGGMPPLGTLHFCCRECLKQWVEMNING